MSALKSKPYPLKYCFDVATILVSVYRDYS